MRRNTSLILANLLTLAILLLIGPGAAPTAAQTDACPPDAETWQGLRVCPEVEKVDYHREDYYIDEIQNAARLLIDELPGTMVIGQHIYTPYSCTAFNLYDAPPPVVVDYIVDPAEAHESGLGNAGRLEFVANWGNLTIADPGVEAMKGEHDAAGWSPMRHEAWFAERVIGVKRQHNLTVDPEERDQLAAMLTRGGDQLDCRDADQTPPTVSMNAGGPETTVHGPFTIYATFSEPVTGLTLEGIAVTNGEASDLDGSWNMYKFMITPMQSGQVTVQIRAGAVMDAAGNPNETSEPFTVTADLRPVPALPAAGAILLAALLARRLLRDQHAQGTR